MSLVHNERAKLTATYLNGVAIALLAVGSFAPMVSAFGTPSRSINTLAAQIGICLIVSGILHLVARRFLRRLVP